MGRDLQAGRAQASGVVARWACARWRGRGRSRQGCCTSDWGDRLKGSCHLWWQKGSCLRSGWPGSGRRGWRWSECRTSQITSFLGIWVADARCAVPALVLLGGGEESGQNDDDDETCHDQAAPKYIAFPDPKALENDVILSDDGLHVELFRHGCCLTSDLSPQKSVVVLLLVIAQKQAQTRLNKGSSLLSFLSVAVNSR